MRRRLSIALALASAAFLCVAFVAPSQAKNTRVSITDFKWSNGTPLIDRGESITWDWLGPDLQHSVTGQDLNAEQWDSDAGNSNPFHGLGDSYEVTFNQPGIYTFQCKLHSSVRGSVVVSNTLGDPNSDAGPQAPINFDREPPYVDGIMVSPTVLGPRGKGGALTFATDESGSADIDYYRLVKRGKKTVKQFAGYSEWNTYLGMNTVPFAKKEETFKAKPGKYQGLFQVTDSHSNSTGTYPIQFEIKDKKKKKRDR
ncbi:MAG: hypothetical protein JJE13_10740 [Thermoleophilia bacterium]|nr:hypothetical protein [Thermoleophilia bacterium]